MDIMEFTKAIKMLSIAYNKDFDEDAIKLWYLNFKDIKIEILINTIKNVIKEKKFMPTIAELLEECEKSKKQKKYEILEQMKKDGYFKDALEYDKAINWLESGVIPSWFKEDMKKYNRLMLENNKLLLN